MRAMTALGVAVCVLGVAAAVTLGSATSMAAGPQVAQTAPPVEQKVESKTSQAPATVDKQVVIEKKAGGLYRPAPTGGPRLGIEIRDVTKDHVATLKLAGQSGVVIDVVEAASAAEKAGLKAKDVVVSYDGETVRSAQQLTRLVRETAPGRAVKVAVIRDGKRMEVDATPTGSADETIGFFIDSDRIRGDIEKQMQELKGQLNQYTFERRAPGSGEGSLRFRMERPLEGGNFQWFSPEGGPLEMLLAPGRGRLGVTVQDLTPELASYFGVKDGVLVSSVTADSPAAKAGIKAGDVITTVNDMAVTTPGELVSHLGEKGGEVTIGLTRDKKPLTLKATIDAPRAPGRRVVLRGTPA